MASVMDWSMDDRVRAGANVIIDYVLAMRADFDTSRMNAAVSRLPEVGAVVVERDAAGDFTVDVDGLVAGCGQLINSLAGLAAEATQEPVEALLETIRDAINMPPDPFD